LSWLKLWINRYCCI